MKLQLALSSFLVASAVASAELQQFESNGDVRLAVKPVDVAGFYNHPMAGARRLAKGGKDVGLAKKMKVDDGESAEADFYDINICNLSVDDQELKFIGKRFLDKTTGKMKNEKKEAKSLTLIPAFSCVEASVAEGQKLCFKAPKKHLSSRECQKAEVTWKEDGNLVFDPYAQYNEISDITGQMEYHGLSTLLPEELEAYLNLLAELKGAPTYRKLTEGRHLTVATRRSDGEAVHRASPAESGVHMWDATYFGQEHSVSCNNNSKNLTLKAVANSPRVFEIDNFLSQDEIAHIMEMSAQEKDASSVYRYDSTQMESIYDRVAAVTKLDPKVLELEAGDRGHEMQVHSHEACKGMAECTAMFGPQTQDYSVKIHPKTHGERFASLILFLNDEQESEGGALEFSRWEHMDEDEESLQIAPKQGKAVLVYHMLEDGNSDEFAHWDISPVKGKGQRLVSTIHISDEVVDKMISLEPLN